MGLGVSPVSRSSLKCLLIVLAMLPATAGAAPLELVIEDVGIRHRTGDGTTTLTLRVENRSKAAFGGTVHVDLKFDIGSFGGEVRTRSHRVRVAVPASDRSIVCFPLPELYPSGRSLEFRLLDEDGRRQAGATLDLKDDTIAWGSAPGVIGILATEAAAVETIQDTVLFRPRASDTEVFEQQPLTFVFLPPDASPCAGAYTGLAYLVIAMPVGELPGPLRGALRTAVLDGLKLVVIDSHPGNPEFLSEITGKGPTGDGEGPAVVGHGLVYRARSADDGEVLAALARPFRMDDGADDLPVRHRIRPRGLIEAGSWAHDRFTPIRVPRLMTLSAAGLLYLLLIGPVSYLALRIRNRPELAWLTTPTIAVVFSLALVPLVSWYRYEGTRLDVALFQYSTTGSEDVAFDAAIRISSRQKAERTVTIRAPWAMATIDSPPIDDELTITWEDHGVEVSELLTPEWSSTNLGLEGWLASGSRQTGSRASGSRATGSRATSTAPVAWTADGIANLTGAPIDEALWLTAKGYFERGGLAAGDAWTPSGSPRPLSELVQRYDMRFAEPWTKAVSFYDLRSPRELLASIRGIFVGVALRPSLEVSLDTPPLVRNDWTVLVHLFPAPEPEPDHGA